MSFSLIPDRSRYEEPAQGEDERSALSGDKSTPARLSGLARHFGPDDFSSKNGEIKTRSVGISPWTCLLGSTEPILVQQNALNAQPINRDPLHNSLPSMICTPMFEPISTHGKSISPSGSSHETLNLGKTKGHSTSSDFKGFLSKIFGKQPGPLLKGSTFNETACSSGEAAVKQYPVCEPAQAESVMDKFVPVEPVAPEFRAGELNSIIMCDPFSCEESSELI